MKYIALGILIIVLFTGCKQQQYDRTIICEGIIKSVEYLQGNFSTNSKTILTMEDGGVFVLMYQQDIIKGSRVRIIKLSSSGYFRQYIFKYIDGVRKPLNIHNPPLEKEEL